MSVNNQAKTREEFKRAKYEEQQKIKAEKQKAKDAKAIMKQDRAKVDRTNEKVEAAPHTSKRIRIRLIPIWVRLVLLVVFTFVSLIAGATVGYGILGGGKVADVFKQSTWTHIQDLVDKE